MGMNALEIKGLTKRYSDNTLALDSLDLTIPEGSFFGLLGPNGAGKTTLINSVTSLVRINKGSIHVFGDDALTDGTPALTARRQIGLSPQEPNLDRFLTVYESLLYHGGYYGLSRAASARLSEEMIDVFDLRDKRDTRTVRLSGGMKRRLLLARALLHKPKLVILDEPTASVDYELRMELWHYIRGLHQAGTTILLTTHYLEEANSLCDKIALIKAGKIIALDSPEDLCSQYGVSTLEEVYLKAVGTVPDHVEVDGFH